MGYSCHHPCVTEPFRVGVTGWAMFGNPEAQTGPGGLRKGKSGAVASPIPRVSAEQSTPKSRKPGLAPLVTRWSKFPCPCSWPGRGPRGHRHTATGGHSPHRNQAISGLLLLHQARSNVSRVPSVRQGHGLHPKKEVITSKTPPRIAVHLASAG